MTGEDATRILTRLPPSGSASAVLTQTQNLCAGDDNDTHITEESFLLLQEENESLKGRLEERRKLNFEKKIGGKEEN